MASMGAAEMGPTRDAIDSGAFVEDASPPSSANMPHGLAILFQPEVYHLLQIVKKYGPSTRFFSDENSMVLPYPDSSTVSLTPIGGYNQRVQ